MALLPKEQLKGLSFDEKEDLQNLRLGLKQGRILTKQETDFLKQCNAKDPHYFRSLF